MVPDPIQDNGPYPVKLCHRTTGKVRLLTSCELRYPPGGGGGLRVNYSDLSLVSRFEPILNLEELFSDGGNEQEPQGKRAIDKRSGTAVHKTVQNALLDAFR